jgi:uncharacterized protein YndB with AHSA1/START domain
MPKTTFTVKKDKLAVVLERVFDAPRDLIWKVISDPQMVPKWWGPAQFETVVDKMDFRVGGEWRFIHKADGQEYAFHGVYKEIVPNERVSDTFNFEPIGPGHELVETMVLEDIGNNQTKMATTSVYNNIEDLEGMVNSGMEGGATETWERLAKLVEKTQ